MIVKKEVLCDWLQFTLPYTEENESEAFKLIGYYSRLSPVRPLFGYGFAQKNDYGAITMTNKNRPEMGVHVQLPGKQCQIMREVGEDFSQLAKSVLAARGHGSRVDLTADFAGVGMRPMELMAAFEKKTRNGTARNASVIYELEGGQTCYVGSWSSDRFARVYEKTRNFGDIDEQILRLELVAKQRYAQAAFQQIADSGVSSAAASALATLNKMVGWQDERWIEMMKDKSTPNIVGRKATAEDDNWLMNVVATSLAKRCIRSDGADFWKRFMSTLARKMEAYGYDREVLENE